MPFQRQHAVGAEALAAEDLELRELAELGEVRSRLVGDDEILQQQRFERLIACQVLHAGIGDRRAAMLERGELRQTRDDFQRHVARFHVAAEVERPQFCSFARR